MPCHLQENVFKLSSADIQNREVGMYTWVLELVLSDNPTR